MEPSLYYEVSSRSVIQENYGKFFTVPATGTYLTLAEYIPGPHILFSLRSSFVRINFDFLHLRVSKMVSSKYAFIPILLRSVCYYRQGLAWLLTTYRPQLQITITLLLFTHFTVC
jgi:hypothetical protein